MIRDYWYLQTPISMYVTLQCHIDIMMIIVIHCDSLWTNCGFLKRGLVDHLGVLQTPIIWKNETAYFYNCHIQFWLGTLTGDPLPPSLVWLGTLTGDPLSPSLVFTRCAYPLHSRITHTSTKHLTWFSCPPLVGFDIDCLPATIDVISCANIYVDKAQLLNLSVLGFLLDKILFCKLG